jgi:hypothetical protein
MDNYLEDYFVKNLFDSIIFNKECTASQEEIVSAISGAISIYKTYGDIFPFFPMINYSVYDNNLDIYWFRREANVSWHYWFKDGSDPDIITSLICHIGTKISLKDNPTLEEVGENLKELNEYYANHRNDSQV